MRLKRFFLALATFTLLLSGTGFSSAPAPSLQELDPPPGPDRYTSVTVDYTAYDWVMKAWSGRTNISCIIVVNHKDEPLPWEIFRDCGEKIPDKYVTKTTCTAAQTADGKSCWRGLKAIACRLQVDHEGMPLPREVLRDCGETIYNSWIKQPPCNELINKSLCSGYYLTMTGQSKKTKQISMILDPATAWLSLEGCHPVLSAATNICETTPTLVITGEDPIPGEYITRIEGYYDNQPFRCNDTGVCKFELIETPDEGAPLEFWAYSSYGDSSFVLEAQIRVKRADEGDPDQLYWYVDVLSPQWRGEVSATCSEIWGVFPPVRGAPKWLTTPAQPDDLASHIPYTYLAANLIRQGVVDARSCPDWGISPGGAANQCGLEKARPAVVQWQNQFDDLILTVARETSVPARLLKNLFARESQFWPAASSLTDVGFGQLTENGADTTLFWNQSFYEQFCPTVLDADVCGSKYMNLTEENQIYLRQALVNSVNATCADCPLGIDLDHADFSIEVFAHTMVANCAQTAQVIYNYTGRQVNEVAGYEDLWKFTLTNYNAGGGCLASAVSAAYGKGLDLTWDNVSPFLTGACSGAIQYVNDISRKK